MVFNRLKRIEPFANQRSSSAEQIFRKKRVFLCNETIFEKMGLLTAPFSLSRYKSKAGY